jgi:hypothetical protein
MEFAEYCEGYDIILMETGITSPYKRLSYPISGLQLFPLLQWADPRVGNCNLMEASQRNHTNIRIFEFEVKIR